MSRAFIVFSGGITAVAFAACAASTPSTPDNPRGVCAVAAPPQMISPANGATGVPDGNFSLVVTATSYSAPLLVAASGAKVQGGPWVAGPSAGQDSSYIPALAAATTYTIEASAPDPCNRLGVTIGTFTTQ